MKYGAASGEEMSRHYSFSSSAIGGEEEARRDAGARREQRPGRAGLMEHSSGDSARSGGRGARGDD